LLCKLAMIPRSSYYKWLTHKGSVLESENEIVMKEIIKIYNKVNGIYGYRRITLNLNSKLKKNYNYKRIYRLMRLSGL
jgi:putative transposase